MSSSGYTLSASAKPRSPVGFDHDTPNFLKEEMACLVHLLPHIVV
ncbi:hypothetical protein [Streptomyces sp. NPDC059009]